MTIRLNVYETNIINHELSLLIINYAACLIIVECENGDEYLLDRPNSYYTIIKHII